MAQCGIGRLERSFLYSLYPSCDHDVLLPVSPAIESHVRDKDLIRHATTLTQRFVCPVLVNAPSSASNHLKPPWLPLAPPIKRAQTCDMMMAHSWADTDGQSLQFQCECA